MELRLLRILSDRISYGYEIVSVLAHLGPLAAGENTVYPLLRRLRIEGLVDTTMVESAKGPPRQYLKLTELGSQQLATRTAEWEELKSAVAHCLAFGGKA